MAQKPRINQEVEVAVSRLGVNGEGIGSLHGFTLFIDGALPGETVRAVVTEVKDTFGRARLVTIRQPSPFRVEPPCPYFGTCGGCQLMHFAYDAQLEAKRQRVVDALQRIAKIEQPDVAPCVRSPHPLGYRNKIQVPVVQQGKEVHVGFYARSSHDVVDVDHCRIHCGLGESVYSAARSLIRASHLAEEGTLRHLIIKSAVNTAQAMAVFVARDRVKDLEPLAAELMRRCPEVKGVVLNVNNAPGNVVLGREYCVLAGQGYIEDTIGGLTFRVSPASFYQVNPYQTANLYTQAIEFAGLSGSETILDAYCGVGTLSLLIAAKAKHVVGVECVPEAIADARENARINGVSNVTFVCAVAEKWLASQTHLAPDVAVLNPPRKGCEPAALQALGRARPKRIIYVSCDPATLARDIVGFVTFGYKIADVQPFDMFPQTAHVETVAKLVL